MENNQLLLVSKVTVQHTDHYRAFVHINPQAQRMIRKNCCQYNILTEL